MRAAAFGLVLVGICGPAFAQENCVAALDANTSVTGNINCLIATVKSLSGENRDLKKALEAIKIEKGEKGEKGDKGNRGEQGVAGPSGIAPSGAILAFDRSAGCPSGWSPFEKGQGRFIIGVGQGSLAYYPFGRIGGVESHTLTTVEMPEHDHSATITSGGSHGHTGTNGNTLRGVVLRSTGVGGDGGNWRSGSSPISAESGLHPHDVVVGSTGKSKPHNNMPPYIALYFCKKN